ncbi:MAG: hydrogenase formation protein HypD [Methanomicrobiales archaeon]|jgi:hydrogenase expression/formation protein HypD|nr:hydrogenase formation protein HypD [Burkholderiaceae bacterium]NLH26300.1 hydrogenase formation protein HypD [Methanomicrobiales archaeon]HMZ31268.1 hydrogenase formation protein HypD [Methanoregulaceae archaeon]HNI42112.1 hydrogenase formation protein HypD [Methanoregulaceae archaeon]HNJ80238.1 hydrogenase formation protein HypD [Methanoregulaceae archaeon]
MAIGKEISEKINDLVDRDYAFMHICGTHEAAIARHGLRSLLPARLKIVMGPGCPVCITPQGEIDAALDLVERGVILATYGDLLRVPGSAGSLESSGGDVRVVQGVHKAVEIAKGTDKEVVFISVGFETTAPTVAATILSKPPQNFSILSCHRLVPPAMKWLLEQGEAHLQGFMLPGHVCTVTGYQDYEQFPVPQVVAGFEAEDILLGLLMLVQQVRAGAHRIDNAYPRAVCREGNPKAKALMYQVFETADVEWRGFPVIPASGLRLKKEFEHYDAQKKFEIEFKKVSKHTACICDKVLRGIAQPSECRLFDRVCTPRTPVGPCMVSHEGACKIWHTYKEKHQ